MWQEHADPLQSPQIQGCNRLLQPILSCGHVRQAQLLLGSCTAVKLAVGGSWELLRQALPSSEMLRMPSAAGAAVSHHLMAAGATLLACCPPARLSRRRPGPVICGLAVDIVRDSIVRAVLCPCRSLSEEFVLDFRQGTPRGAERPCSLTGLEHQLVIQVDKSESGMGKQ